MLGQIRESNSGAREANGQLRAYTQAYYFDDTWKVRSKLTITLGLRYELTQPWKANHDTTINAHIPSFADPARRPTLVRQGIGDFYEGIPFRFNPAIQVARDGRLGDRLVQTDYNDLAPRIGLAYSPTAKWTLRTGFGVFYTQDIGNGVFEPVRNSALRLQESSNNDFPNLTFDRPFTSIVGVNPVTTPIVFAIDNRLRTGYVMQYLFNVQREVTKDLVVELGYMGNAGHKLWRIWGLNFPLPGPGDVQSRRPYNELGFIQYVAPVVNSNYNAASLKVQQRFSRGLTYLISYTFSKAIDNGSAIRSHPGEPPFPQNPLDLKADRGLATHDERHRFVTSLLWELPIGKGQRFLNTGGVLNFVLGGWQIGTILNKRSGLPFTPNYGQDSANIGYDIRPNATGISPKLSDATPNRFFNTAAFARVAPYTYGNLGRTNVIGPGLFTWDFSTMKRFPIPVEGHALEFRFEAFNFGNHPNWGAPDSTFFSAAFGRITSTFTTMRSIQFALKYVF
jgi:hypothetical protein